MRFTNHIALRFLTDDTLAFEMIETTHFKEVHKIINKEHLDNVMSSKVRQLWKLVSRYNQKAYVVTETVHDKLDMLKVKTDSDNHYDWTVFSELKSSKKTFILNPTKQWDGGGCLRFMVDGTKLCFCHLGYRFEDKKNDKGKALWTMFYIDKITNEHGEHCEHQNVKDIQEFCYKLLCFIFLSENDFEVIQPGKSHGKNKKEKIKNDFPIPITVINSKWNITSIRTDGFWVSGHFALRRCGVGRTQTKMVYIEPFEKHGYVRRAANSNI